ncbi:MAG: hypothetical protein GF401_05975 [Chitinivibrionales bacterium]|nr:hypothetical protein [Chitinivibrionales bacterium]
MSEINTGLLSNRRGLTFAEAMIAAAILGLAVTAIMGVLVTADRIRGRRDRVASTAFVVSNEAERIRKTAARWDSLNDTVYEAMVNNMTFEVNRKVIPVDPLIIQKPPYAKDIEITVRRIHEQENTKVFRMIQGYSK